MGDCLKCSLQEKCVALGRMAISPFFLMVGLMWALRLWCCRREVAALELLVGRYQQELQASASCCVCGRRAHQTLSVVEEELFENQRLDTLQWSDAESAAPQFARRNGQRCEFDQVGESGSCCRSDSFGTQWSYADKAAVYRLRFHRVNGYGRVIGMLTWAARRMRTDGRTLRRFKISQREKAAAGMWNAYPPLRVQGCSAKQSRYNRGDLTVGDCSDRMVGHRTRRRRWKRERKFIGSTDLPRTASATLGSEAHLCALVSRLRSFFRVTFGSQLTSLRRAAVSSIQQNANKKLTEQVSAVLAVSAHHVATH
jgi:hypothetical protein